MIASNAVVEPLFKKKKNKKLYFYSVGNEYKRIRFKRPLLILLKTEDTQAHNRVLSLDEKTTNKAVVGDTES